MWTAPRKEGASKYRIQHKIMSDHAEEEDYGYGVAIDAGSSGSRIYVYRWPTTNNQQERSPQHHLRNNNNDAVASSFTKVDREAIFSEEITPGISSENGVGITLLEDLILSAKDALPQTVDISSTPIYLGATAGMRIIDSTFEADVMSRIQIILHKSGFQFQDSWARTISGEEEGVYDWLAANYLLQLQHDDENDSDNVEQQPSAVFAYGALDLGGASTQISFPLASETTSSRIGDSSSFPIRIDNIEYPLYTQSFLYYGVDQARLQYDTKYASQTKTNPCYPSGYIDGETNISGSSDWNECLDSVAQIFDQNNNTSSHNCNGGKRRCLTNGGMHHLPMSENQKFIAMSAFVYTWDYLGLNIGADTDDLDTLNTRAKRVCGLTHEQQTGRYNTFMERKPDMRKSLKPHAQCFNAAFSYHLLNKGYGLPTANTPIEIYYDIDGVKVQWLLGLMLVEVNKLGSMFKQNAKLDDIVSGVGYTYNYLVLLSCVALIVLTAKVLGRMNVRKRASSEEEEEELLHDLGRSISLDSPTLPLLAPDTHQKDR